MKIVVDYISTLWAQLPCFGIAVRWQRHTLLRVVILLALVLTFPVSTTSGGELDASPSGSIAGWGIQMTATDLSQGFQAVSAGGSHSLALRTDGSLVAWGANVNGQSAVPQPNTGFTAVSTGAAHSLGLKGDGSIIGWGYNEDGACDVPEPNSGFVAVAAGNFHSLGLMGDGSIVAWGDNWSGQNNVPDVNTEFVAIAGGGSHSLGLKADGSIVAWGGNNRGQCDIPAPNTGFVAIAAGKNHSLGLKVDGSIVAWGDNVYGQCNVPAPNTGFVALAGGDWHSLGIKDDGTIVGWGRNNSSQRDAPSPNAAFVAMAAGGWHSLGLKANGEIVTWGRNAEGQGNVPPPNAGFVSVAAGLDNGLGLRKDGSIVGWGRNVFGQLDVPESATGYVGVVMSLTHSLGLNADGSITGWGRNDSGQCDTPSLNTDFMAMAAGLAHSLGLKASGTIVAWGSNLDGQCDVPLPNLDFVAIAAGERHSLGLRSDGSIAAWGGNERGQCDVPEPNFGFMAVAAGARHSLGLREDGSVVAWGANDFGQCDVPASASGFVAVAAGDDHSVGLKADGSITVWGSNRFGQCDVPEPNVGFVTLASGGYHVLAIRGSSGRIISPNRSGALVAGDVLRFAGSDSDASRTTHLWNFGDGRSASVHVPGLVRFPDEGSYTITYSATDPGQLYATPDTRSLSVVADTGDIPDFRVLNVSVPDNLLPGQSAAITYTAVNAGNGGINGMAWSDAIYASRDPYLDINDTRLGSDTMSLHLGPGDSYTNTIQITAPLADVFYLIVVINEEWSILERHRLNNEQAVPVTTDVPYLEPGVELAAQYAAGRVGQYYRINATTAQHLLLTLGNSTPGLVMLVSFGALPTVGTHDYRSTEGDPSLVIPAATSGDWYILIYGDMGQAGNYSIQLNAADLLLTHCSPSIHTTQARLDLVVSGAGFFAPTQIELISDQGVAYAADVVEVASMSQVAAQFVPAAIPPGIYSVRVTVDDGVAELMHALEVVVEGHSQLETRLILPGSVGTREAATFYVEYSNRGNVPMLSPLLVLQSSDPLGGNQPILSLDANRANMGIWRAGETLPHGFDHRVQFLTFGDAPGLLLPGESRRVPVYYAGLSKIDSSDPRLRLRLGVLHSDDSSLVDWASLKADLRPSYVREDAWNILWSNFISQVGTTWGDYVALLNRNAVYLKRQGQDVQDVTLLLAFALRQADGLSPLPSLATGEDAMVQAPGLPITFHRSYSQPISRRHELGPLGRGWTHNWQYGLEVQADGNVVFTDMSGTPRMFQLDARSGRPFISSPGDAGTLRTATGGGYTLTEANGVIQGIRSDGKLDYIADPNDNRITCEYTGERLTRLVHSSGGFLTIGYDSSGQIKFLRDNLDRQTEYDYNGEHLVSVRYPDGRVINYEYNTLSGSAAQHALTGVSLSDGSTRTFRYDSRGRLAGIARDEVGEHIDFGYGAEGRVTATNTLGHVSTFFLDAAGQIVRTENPLGSTVQFGFEELGRLTSITDPAGVPSTFGYDRQGNLAFSTDALRRTTRFQYTSVFNRLASVTDANGSRTAFTYDLYGNPTNVSHADNSSESWMYDARGNPITWANRRGNVITNTYDEAGRVIRKSYASGSQLEYAYDARGNLMQTVDANGINTFTYNNTDYLVRIDHSSGRWLAFTYDAAGRRASILDQTGHHLKYQYDAAGRLERMTNEFNNEVVHYEYDAAGRLFRKTVGNGVYTEYAYDAAGQLVSLFNKAPSDTVISRFEYTYDRRGRRSAMTTHYGAWSYEYDADNQLSRAVLTSTDPRVPNQDLQYTYDALGNRTQATLNSNEESYSANALNQYIAAGNRTYTYDADGNLMQEEGPDGLTSFIYDEENRLVGAMQGVNAWEYIYDALGNRVAANVNGVSTHYSVDPIGIGSVLAEYDANGDLRVHYDHGLGLLNRTDSVGNSAHYTFDAMGSSSEVSGTDGAVLNSYAYRPFGERILADSLIPNPFQFVGEWGVMAEATGLDFMRARFYAPHVGRFMSADPIGFSGNDFNLYRYARNNPVTLLDPRGTTWTWTCGTQNAGPPSWGIGIGFGVASIGVSAVANVGFTAGAGGGVPGPNAWVPYNTPIGGAGLNFGAGIGASLGVSYNLFEAGLSYGVSAADWWCGWVKNPVTPPPVPIAETAVGETTIILSLDPNHKTGPAGYGEANFVAANQVLTYRVDFENLESATAPAQVVTVSDPLSSDLDWTTFELTEIGFGDELILIPANQRQHFETTVGYAFGGQEFQVHIEAGIHLITGQAFAYFYTIDPNTGLPPPAAIGFLPPEDGTGRGQGHIAYFVRPKSDLPSGATIRNVATIQFDFGLKIDTNQIDPLDPSQGFDPNLEALVTIDAGPPSSSVAALPGESGRTFMVQWSGEDDPGGSGITGYDIYVSTNGGLFGLWLAGTAVTSMPFIGELNQTYAFYSMARDGVGNREAAPFAPDAQTFVSANSPILAVVTNQVLSVGLPFSITNVVLQGLPAGEYLFSLLHGPMGASLNPTNGTMQWTPPCSSGSTTNPVVVWVTDSGQTNLSDAVMFDLVVRECLLPRLGTLVVPAGGTGALPIYLYSTEVLTNVLMSVELPEGRLTATALEVVAPEICSESLVQVSNALYEITLVACAEPWLQPTQGQLVAWLYVTAASNQPSAFVHVGLGNTIGTQPNGTTVTNYVTQTARVVIVGEEPLLEAVPGDSGHVQVILYALPGTTNVIETTSQFSPPVSWLFWQQVSPDDVFYKLPPAPAAHGTLFFRAQRQ